MPFSEVELRLYPRLHPELPFGGGGPCSYPLERIVYRCLLQGLEIARYPSRYVLDKAIEHLPQWTGGKWH